MTKFLAVVKREYTQRVRAKMFILLTVLGPVMLLVFTVVPGLLFNIKTGETRLAIVDQTEGQKLFEPIRRAIQRDSVTDRDNPARIVNQLNSNAKERLENAGKRFAVSFSIERADLSGRSLDEVKRNLNNRIGKDELDGYLVIPADILTNTSTSGKVTYYGRNVGDVMTTSQIHERFERAIRTQRLMANGVKEEEIEKLSRPVELATYPVNEKGEEGSEDSGMSQFTLVFMIAFLIYITVLLYGQVVLGAIVEEKETRIAEILFSSVRSLTLMVGKLIGVSLVALTQLAIWGAVFLLISLYGISALEARGVEGIHLPQLPPMFFVFFVLYFILGYFVYATIYALIGSMVTNAQEGGQLAMPVVFTLLAGLYMAFVVIRSPNAPFAVWVSMIPLFSPITMMVRIVGQTPPMWQILLSLGIGYFTVFGLIWLTARIYRIGMLMYGKRATIPEVMRWVRQQ
jgi:ABC-2 type transport system permease protein